ncbi:MAG TPA: hypothetical protein VFL93_03070, partial [Longimicrobiaceae bacterium]|nr:hypothetical protein [Longimicrobiaceae bacterium]
RDSTDLLHTIALRHGAQRARFGWTEEALRRELEILREEIAAALRRHYEAGAPPEVSAVLDRILSPVDAASLRGLRSTAAASG